MLPSRSNGERWLEIVTSRLPPRSWLGDVNVRRSSTCVVAQPVVLSNAHT